MDIYQSAFRLLSTGAGTVGFTPIAIPTSAAPYRLALQIANCDSAGTDSVIYVGYTSSVSSTYFIGAIYPGSGALEMSVRSTIPIWIVGSTSSVNYAYAEIA